MAECLAANDRERLQRLIATAFALYLVMSAVAIGAVVIFSVLLPHLYPHLSLEEQHLAQKSLLLLGAFQCATFLFAPQSAILYGAGRSDLISRTSALVGTTQTLANVWLALRGYGLLALCLSAIIGGITSGVLLRRLACQNIYDAGTSLRGASWNMARELLKYGSRYSFMSIAGAIGFSSDVLILGFMLPAAAITQYAVASKLSGIVSLLAGKPISSVIPAFAHLETTGDRAGQFRLVVQTGRASVLISLPFVLSFCIFGDRIIHAWVGDGFQRSYPVMVTLALGVLLSAPAGPCVNLMIATDKNLFLTRAYIIAALCNLGLSILLTKQLGIVGPALSTLIAIAGLELSTLPLITCRLFGFSIREFWAKMLLPMGLPALTALAAALLMKSLPPTRSMTLIALCLVIGACWAVWFRFSLGSEARQRLIRGVRQRLPH